MYGISCNIIIWSNGQLFTAFNLHLLILRSDYMLDAPTNSLKLVEYNTIASSLSSHCQRVRQVQSYILDKYSDKLTLNYSHEEDDQLSKNNIETMAAVFFRSCQLYSEHKHRTFPEIPKQEATKLWALFVIDENERNICDQKWVEVALYEAHGV